MLSTNLLILSEPKWVEVCDSRWFLWLVLVPCGHGAFVFLVSVVSGACLYVWLTGAAGLLHRSVMVPMVRCPLQHCVAWDLVCSLWPREFLAAWFTRLTSSCSVLQYAAAKCPQEFFISGLAHVDVLCVQVCRNYIERPKLGSFCHGTTVLTTYLVATVLVEVPQW